MLFFNTDGIGIGLESNTENAIQNHVEASLILQSVEILIKFGLDEQSIGIISPFHSQLRLIAHTIKHRPNVEIHTVDRFQGRDKRCILISTARSNAGRHVAARKLF